MTRNSKNHEINKTAESKLIDLVSIEAELRGKTTEELRVEFEWAAFALAQSYARAAICVKLLEERGERVQHNMIGTLRRIASGQTLPEVVAKFTFSPILNDVSLLPLNDQRKLAENTVIPIVEESGSGYTTRMVDVAYAPKNIAQKAVTRDGILQPEEQQAKMVLSRRTSQAATQKATPGDDMPSDPLARSITLKMTEAEYRTIATQAAAAGLSTMVMARRLCIKAGVFKAPKP